MSAEITRRWRDLAEKRRAHLIELYDSGRWKHYYTEEELVTRMREAINLRDAWDRLSAGPRGLHSLAAQEPRAFSLR